MRGRTFRARLALVILGLAAGLIAFRRLAAQVLELTLGAAALAFFALPVARRLEGRLKRPWAALAGLGALAAGIGAVLAIALPTLVRELAGLSLALPRSLEALTSWARQAGAAVSALLPGVALPEASLDGFAGRLPDLASGALALAADLAGRAGDVSLAAILSYFFLCDRDRLLLRLELLIPRAVRGTAVRAGQALARELRLYLRAQLLIALSVGILSVAALLILRVRSALVLGMIIGLMNMIPYFGPLLGGIPAALVALGDGPRKALFVVLALCAVQQVDGSLLSPRIMGSITGLSPASVLVALFCGARLGGVGGMLLSVPALLVFRTLFRVCVQRAENI